MASWLVRSSPDRAVRVRALAEDIVSCSWARHFTLTVPLSTQEYEWVPANCWGKTNKLLRSDEVTCDGLASRPGGVEISLAASCCGFQLHYATDRTYNEPLGGIANGKIRDSPKTPRS